MGMLLNIQKAMAARIVSDPWMSGLEVATQSDGDLDAFIAAKLSKLGIAVTVGLGKAGAPMPNVSTPYFEEVLFVVEVQEFVMMNNGSRGTKKPAVDVCERIAVRLHGFEYDEGKTLYCVDPGIIPAIPARPATSAYAVAFETPDGVDIAPQTEGHTS